MTQLTISHDENLMRYSLFEDGLEAYLTYTRPRMGHRHITHTIVPGRMGGRGLDPVRIADFRRWLCQFHPVDGHAPGADGGLRSCPALEVAKRDQHAVCPVGITQNSRPSGTTQP